MMGAVEFPGEATSNSLFEHPANKHTDSRRRIVLIVIRFEPSNCDTTFGQVGCLQPEIAEAAFALPPRAILLPLLLTLRRFQPKNDLAFFHQVEPIAGDCFQIGGIGLEQADFARLPTERQLVLVHLGLKIVDLTSALHQPFVGWNEEADDRKPDGEDEQDTENPIEPLPDSGVAPFAEIQLIHVSAA
jgi:hypothetical protein